jgi:hypothetical protein
MFATMDIASKNGESHREHKDEAPTDLQAALANVERRISSTSLAEKLIVPVEKFQPLNDPIKD